jgi:hypothetical protein
MSITTQRHQPTTLPTQRVAEMCRARWAVAPMYQLAYQAALAQFRHAELLAAAHRYVQRVASSN